MPRRPRLAGARPSSYQPAVTKLQVDFEHASRVWWEAGGQELWEGICEDGNFVFVDDAIGQSWLVEAEKLPGWSEGHEYAPHPIASSPVSDEEAEIE